MGRIRTIKPEFPDSVSMSHVCRDARLLFILSWTIADDHGRLRGDPRFLAHKLFPDDVDAEVKMPGWIRQLVAESCVQVYRFERGTYLAITNWPRHQRIDHPGASRLPAPPRLGQVGLPFPERPDEQLPLADQTSEIARARRRNDAGRAVDKSVGNL